MDPDSNPNQFSRQVESQLAEFVLIDRRLREKVEVLQRKVSETQKTFIKRVVPLRACVISSVLFKLNGLWFIHRVVMHPAVPTN